MDIRDASFWREIEQLFTDKEIDQVQSVRERGSRLTDYAQFMDRLRVSTQRARRSRRHALLVLVQFEPQAITLSSGGSQMSAGNPLLVCRLSSCLRSSDSLCDLGGARYAVLLDDVREPSAAPLVIEKLLTTLSGPSRPGGESLRWAQPHLGATLFPVDGMALEGVWLSAETALEQAAQSGPGAYSISPMVTGQAAMERFELSKDLYKAYRNNEFETVYQPIVDVSGGRILAVEAFLRWRHPMRGDLAPESFLSLLEESGIIVPVGERMLVEACQMLSRLTRGADEAIRVCVNVSARQLEDSGFLFSVLDALYDAELDPGLLQLEFPEKVLAQRPDLIRRILPELRNAGVRLALDQFGVGEAPLADLVRLPIDLIKIDRTLIGKLPGDVQSQAITSGTLALANATGMRVAAVGVEQTLQTGALQRLGCHEAQGRLYYRPVSGSELRALLA